MILQIQMILQLLIVIFTAAIFIALIGVILTIWSFKKEWQDANKNILELNKELNTINTNMDGIQHNINSFTKSMF